MKSLSRIYLFTAIFVFLSGDCLLSFESSFYTVLLKNFSPKIFSAKKSIYRIILKSSDFILPETASQRIRSKGRKDNDFFILLECGDQNLAMVKEDRKRYLSDTLLLDIHDPRIQKIKERFSGSHDIIKDVEDFVYSYITNKTIGVPIGSVDEILKEKTGDCTEHTVLAVSILRSLGIPARALTGMLLSEEFEGKKNVFVYHMWAEAFSGGKWVIVDAANPGEKHENRYIAFAYHHLETGMPLSYLKAVSAMRDFSVEYIKSD